MDFERPRIKLTLTPTDKLLDRLAIAGLAFVWIYVLVNFINLPDTISTHYNLKGEVDGHGSKITIIIVPVIFTILIVGITLLNRYPYVFNYPQRITEDNAEQQYRLATRFMRYLKITMVIIAICIVLETVSDAHRSKTGFAMWEIPLLIVLINIPMVIYFYQLSKLNKKDKNQ